MKRIMGTQDSAAPIAFVGREKELAELHGFAQVMRRVPADAIPDGAMRCVHGVPGAGKTAMKREFQRQWNVLEDLRVQRLQERKKPDGGTEGVQDPPVEAPVLCAAISTAELSQKPVALMRAITEKAVDSHALWKAGPLRNVDGHLQKLRNSGNTAATYWTVATWASTRRRWAP